jgi:hypothetical protein
MTTAPTFFSLFNPGKRKLIIFSGLAFAVILWCFLVGYGALSVSKASAIAFALVILAVAPKWLEDIKVYGASVAVLGMLITVQLLHLLEHGTQMVQFYRLALPAGQSLGLISALNVEWVHFIWNWLVWGLTLFLVTKGMRNFWAYALLTWATLHSLEHTYLLVRYLQVLSELSPLGLQPLTVTQALPGVLGRNGWLALSEWCARVPGLTTAPRSVIHFWWNVGEIVLLLLAARGGTAKLWSRNLLSKAGPRLQGRPG